MSKHTPGPWIVCAVEGNTSILSIEQDRSHLVDEEPSIIGEIDLQGDGIDEEVGAANARLIAAAPALLEALRECITDDGAACMNTGQRERRLKAIDAICRAAIAKAE